MAMRRHCVHVLNNIELSAFGRMWGLVRFEFPGPREGNITFVSCDRAGHPVAKWTLFRPEAQSMVTLHEVRTILQKVLQRLQVFIKSLKLSQKAAF